MFWLLLAAALGAEANGNRAYAARGDNEMPICGGCRNQINEQATTCEHCSAKVVHSRRALLTVAGLAGGNFSLIGTGILLCLAGIIAFESSFAAGAVGFVLGSLLITSGGALAYPAVKIHGNKPAREVDLISRLPLPRTVTRRLDQNRGSVGIALIAVGGLVLMTGIGFLLGVAMIGAGVATRRFA